MLDEIFDKLCKINYPSDLMTNVETDFQKLDYNAPTLFANPENYIPHTH